MIIDDEENYRFYEKMRTIAKRFGSVPIFIRKRSEYRNYEKHCVSGDVAFTVNFVI